MKIVIDTNCLISCIGKKSPYRNVFDAFLENKFSNCASSEILLEYEELFNRFWGNNVANNLLGLFETSDNFEQVLVHFNWQLISKDDDDNKFIDTYIAVGADLLISNDSSITSLKANVFPPFNILTLQEFSNFLNPQ
ncbi:MAG: putative toxin-antitoxin system toxin component, PIN family [Chitinophagaceae bacterium]|nr:putative toxin-antitoxin system toxin component, PIN family [Chitinophagaceae bacterium]MBP6477493.1 putative toxin-antitoxin system toxin component, PIN family [Chitinophagaceae bacterium]MBP7107000.1 putative toxin-antitoxin system toxin component, PIN family [Chitinophagaceae bacterium]MBP7314696.1 putative toxin-antitoxin system toxin component, PIN family [Chitinophagaceae bacterium]HQX97607.1 putative toxin-antitoxin system toxin component, PIN family [Chitinophagaceae bacterium]